MIMIHSIWTCLV